jgi:hypothetical protein
MANMFREIELEISTLLTAYSIVASKEFLTCADEQLATVFTRETGLKPGKELRIVLTEYSLGVPVYTQYPTSSGGVLYKLQPTLYVNNHWNPITIHWRSKNGKPQCKLHETTIDCNDVEFWFEGLDRELYYKQLYPGDKLPFRLKDPGYELTVTRINLEMTIAMQLKNSVTKVAADLIPSVDKFIDSYNETSIKNDRKDGVVHNWKRAAEGKMLTYEIDTGSAGMTFLKKFLIHLTGLNCFARVELK